MFTVTNLLLLSVLVFAILSSIFFIQHEIRATTLLKLASDGPSKTSLGGTNNRVNIPPTPTPPVPVPVVEASRGSSVPKPTEPVLTLSDDATTKPKDHRSPGSNHLYSHKTDAADLAKKGSLVCNGVPTDSEIIYWKIVPGDDSYESSITPHHE
jgi:hypothetical protein